MHQSRKTHNAHNETQRRLAKTKDRAWWIREPREKVRNTEDGKVTFLVEGNGSLKFFKRIANEPFVIIKMSSKESTRKILTTSVSMSGVFYKEIY